MAPSQRWRRLIPDTVEAQWRCDAGNRLEPLGRVSSAEGSSKRQPPTAHPRRRMLRVELGLRQSITNQHMRGADFGDQLTRIFR